MKAPGSTTPGLRRALLALAFLAGAALAQAAPPQAPPPLSLLVLGSGGPGATGRAGSGYLVLLDGRPRILVDAGPGTFARVGEAGVSLAEVDTVLLTHLHADHAGGLPGLVKGRAVAARRDITFQVFGPEGRRGGRGEARFPSTRQFISLLFGPQGAFSYLHDFAGEITFTTRDVAPRATPQTLLRQEGLGITALPGHHRDAPSVIYRVDYAGKSITFSGDIDAAGHPALRRLAQGTDLLVFNSVVLDPPGSAPVLYTLHTAPKDIGAIAEQAQARHLLLSHLNPSIDEAQAAVKASVAAGFTGTVTFASDGLKIVP